MRRPPFTVRPLALSVTLAIATPVAVAADIAASAVASPQEVNNVVLTASDNVISVATEVTGIIKEQNDTNSTQLIKQGAGTLSLTNNNTYKGGTDVQAGTLSVARAASLGDGAVNLAGGSTLETQSSTTLTQNILLKGDASISTGGIKPAENITQVTSTISGDGGLIKSGAGTLSLTADNGYKGNTTISEGTLAISRGGSLGSGSEIKIENAATLKTNQNVTISQNIVIDSGDIAKIDTGGKNSVLQGQIKDGTLEKTGNGSLTLTNAMNNQEKTTLNGGILIINDAKNLGQNNNEIEIKKGTLQTSTDMTLANTIVTSGSSGGSINTAGHNVDLAGQITGNGRLVKTGGGTLTLTNSSNDYNIGVSTDVDGKTVAIIGNTVINGGVLAVSNNEQLGKQPEDVTANLEEKDQYKWKLGNVQIDGGTLKTESSVDSNRHIVIGNAGATIDVNGAANTTKLSGLISGTGSLVKEGDGTLNLSLMDYKDNNGDIATSFVANKVGGISVNAGVLEVNNTAKDLGGAVAVNLSGGELRINQGTGADLGVVTLKGTGGTIDTTGATITTGEITGSGGLKKQGSGTLVLTGLNNQKFTGDTTISEGKVQINSAQGLGTTGQLVLDGGSLQVVGNTEVTLNKSAVITSNNGTVDNVSSNVTLSGVVSGAGQLVKSGAGKFSLTNEKNSFEGGVRIKDGTLEVSTDGSLGKANTQVLIDGATLAITKDAELTRQVVLTEKGGTVAVAGTNTATLSGTLSLDAGVLSADFTKSGTGTLNLTKDNTNFKGNTIIQEGTLGITGKDNLAQGKLFLDGGNLRTNASLNFDKEIIINSTGGIDTSLDALGNKTEVTVTSKIQGNGGLVKTGEGTLTLSADNAYAGGTQVKGGTLVVNQDTNLGLSSTNIELDGGTVKLTNANSIDFKTSSPKQSDGNYPDARKLSVGSAGGSLDISSLQVAIETEISGKGTLTQKGNNDSILTLTANNTQLEGGITVENGTLKIQDNTNLGGLAATLTLKDGTTLDTTNANADLVLDRSLTLGDGKVTLKQDENVTIERGLIGSNKANLTIDTASKKLVLNGDNSSFAGNLLVKGTIEAKQNLGTGSVEFNQGVDSSMASLAELNITGNANLNNQFKLNGQVGVTVDKDKKATFNAAIKDAEYTKKDGANNDVVDNRVGQLIKLGQGEMVLNTENAFSGGAWIAEGTVTVAHNKALGAKDKDGQGTDEVKLFDGTTLQSAGDIVLDNTINLQTGVNVTLATPQNNQQATSLTLNNIVSGDSGITKTGVGTLTLKGENTYTGQTVVNEGTVAIDKANALGTNANVTLKAGTTLKTTAAIAGLNKNIALTGQDGLQATINTAGGDVALTGALTNDGINKVGIIKEGVSTLTLSGDNSSYQGKTTIKEGNIAISDAKNLGGKVDVELAGGGLTLLSNLTIGANINDAINITGGTDKRGEINTATGTTSELGVAFKGTGKFVKQGDGELVLSGNNTDFTGGVSVDKGTLTITKDASLGKTNIDVVLNGGTLQANGVTTLDRNVQLTKDSTIKNISSTQTVTLNRLTKDADGNAYQITLEGGAFNLASDGTHSNQHNGTLLKNTTVSVKADSDLGQNSGKLTFDGNSTLDVQGQLSSTRNVVINNASNILDTNTNQVSLAMLSGTGSISKSGTGDLILNQNSQNYSGTITVNEASVVVGADEALGTGQTVLNKDTVLKTNVAVNLANKIEVNQQATIDTMDKNSTLNGVVSGTANLDKVGSGSLSLNGVNSFVGELDVQAGKVIINNANSLGADGNSVKLQTGTTLATSADVTAAQKVIATGDVIVDTMDKNSTLNGVVSGTANLDKVGSGSLSLNGVNSFVGELDVQAGKVIINNANSLGADGNSVKLQTGTTLATSADVTAAQKVIATGDVIVDTMDKNSTLNGVVSGTANLDKVGSGSLSLNGVNSFVGELDVQAGKVIINNANSLGADGNSVKLQTGTTLATSADVTAAQKVIATGDVIVDTMDKNSTLNGVVSGNAAISKAGTGTLSLNGTNTFVGSLAVTEGKVAINNANSLGANSNSVSLANNTSLSTTAAVTAQQAVAATGNVTIDTMANDSTLSGVVSGNAAISKAGAGTLSLNGTNTFVGSLAVTEGKVAINNANSLGANSNSVSLANNTSLSTTAAVTAQQAVAATGNVTIDTMANDSTLSWVVSGNAAISKAGAGTLSLNGTNTFVGSLAVTEGKVAINNANSLGANSNSVSLANNTSLSTTAAVTAQQAVAATGNVTIDTMANDSTLSGVVSGNAAISKAGAGTLSLNGTNTFVGSLAVTEGKVAINNANSLGANSNSVSLANNTSLSTTAAVTAQQAVAATGNVTIDTMANDSTLSGVVSGNAAISKAGAGTLSLNGTNTFVGSLAVTEGKVAINNANSLGANSNSVSLANNTSLSTTAAVTAQQAVAATGNVTIDTMANDSTLSGVVSGNAAISKAGTGKLTLAGANTVVGDITVNAGSLALANAQALGATSNKVVLNQAALIAAINNLTVNNQIEINNSAIIDTGINTLNINSAISGGTLSKTGSGTLVLTGTNTQNATVVNQGKLQVANNSALGATDANVTLNGATFESSATQTYARNFVLGNTGGVFNTLQSTTVTLSNTVSGDGALTKTGTGTLVLAGANAYKGSTNVSAGKLVVSQANNLGQTTNINLGTATLETKADMSLQNVVLSGVGTILTDNKLTIAGVVSGAGGLVKQGSGSLELSSENTYSGGTTLEAGTLTLANSKSIGTGNLVVKSGQVVLKDGFVSTQALIQNAESSSDITGKGTFSNAEVNSGMLTINGDITTTTNTTIKNNSTLFVNGSLSSLNTIIDNGTLFINGSLTSPITVGSRAKLAGRGTITGNVAVNGLLSPGNSPAILTINGDVDQKEGSSLLVEIDGATAGSGAGHHDQVVSSGNYNIAASNTVLEAKLRGITGDATNSFVPSIGQSFDVVKAKAVNGAFATYKQPTEGLAAGTRLDIGYTANSIRLYVTPVTYTSVASGENATGAAKFLDNVLVLKDTDIEVAQIYNAILPANSQQLQAAMINMSPALYAESAQSVLALQQKLHNSQTISETFKQGGLALRGFQQDTDVDSDGNGLAATRSISGVQLSVDSEPYANDWQMGAAVSIVNKADVESNSSALKLSGHDVALTVRKKVSDWMLGATVDMGNYTFDTNRNINIVGTQFKTNQQDVKTSSYGVGVQASRNYGSWTLATGLRYNNVKQDGFVEQGNSLLALKVADVEQDQVVAMLGGAWQNTWKTQMWNIVPKLSLDLEQVVAGDTAQAKAMLGAGQVTATASDAGKTLFRAGLGVNFVNKDGITIGVDASTEQADNLSANTGRLTFSKSF